MKLDEKSGKYDNHLENLESKNLLVYNRCLALLLFCAGEASICLWLDIYIENNRVMIKNMSKIVIAYQKSISEIFIWKISGIHLIYGRN